jgi:hydroxylaminobenzene mutase
MARWNRGRRGRVLGPSRPGGRLADLENPVIDPKAPTAPAARLLALASAWLVLLGFLTGIYVAQAMTGKVPADPKVALASHLNALLGAFLMLGVASTLRLLRYGPVGQKRLAWAFIVSNFANWFVTAVKAWWHVAGVDMTTDPRNNLIFGVLGALVVAPSLLGATAWVYGFYGPRTGAE